MSNGNTPLDPNSLQIISMLGEMRAKQEVILRVAFSIARKQLEHDYVQSRHETRIGSIEHQMALVSLRPEIPDWEPAKTGQHDVATLKRTQEELAELEQRFEHAEERKFQSGIWWKRQRWVWTMAAVGFVLACAISSGCAIAVSRLTAPTPAVAK